MSTPRTLLARRDYKEHGFTLIELMIVVVILGILAALGVYGYVSMIDRARVVQAIGDIRALSLSVDDYWMAHGEYPNGLVDIGADERRDPWGNPYAYKPVTGNGGGTRKDRNLVPINTDYDLYSKGPDGRSAPPLTAQHSRDDIVRAANGGFIGVAENY